MGLIKLRISDLLSVRLFPLLLMMGIIFFLSHQKGSSIHLPAIPYIDKAGHMLVYSILAGTALFALPVPFRQEYPFRTMVIVFSFCLLYGISDELHQVYIPERDASVYDLFADLAGAFFTVFIWYQRRVSQSPSIIH